MNAQAVLQSYGWAGPGHPLHPSAYKQKGHRGLAYDPNSAISRNTLSGTSNGLIKPLLVSQKQGNLGIGRRAHEPQAGNEWWLKGFERALGDIGKSESERTSGTNTPVAIENGLGGKFGTLYSFFVRGGQMEGTISEAVSQKGGKKRKSDVLEDDGEDSVGQDKEKMGFETIADFMAVRDKDEKRRRRREKESAEEEFKVVGAFMEVRDGNPRKKRKSDRAEVRDDSPPPPSQVRPKKKRKSEQPESPMNPTVETKEERRERRRRRREVKQSKDAVPLMTNGQAREEGDATAKALRKAEKKRRKAERPAREAAS